MELSDWIELIGLNEIYKMNRYRIESLIGLNHQLDRIDTMESFNAEWSDVETAWKRSPYQMQLDREHHQEN